MINIKAGEFQLETHDLVIGPDLLASTFKASAIPILSTQESNGWKTFFFNAAIEGMLAEFVVCFRREMLHILGWVPQSGEAGQEWGTVSSEEQKRFLDAWLSKYVGPSPYVRPWGEISADRDIKTGDYGIVVLYRREILARADTRDGARPTACCCFPDAEGQASAD